MSWKSLLTPGYKQTDVSKARRWFAYSLVILGLTIDNLNVSATLAGAASIEKQFNASSSTVSWALSAYALTLCAFIITFGKLSDIFGAHLVYLGGIAVFAIFLLLIAVVKSSIVAMIVFRAIQGIAGSAIVPSAYAITANYFKGKDFQFAARIFAISLTGSLGVGEVVGGALGYENFFWLCFALCTFVVIVLYPTIIPIEKTEGHELLSFKSLNFPVVLFLVTGLLLIILGLTEAATGWRQAVVYVPIPIGVLCLVFIPLFENVYLKSYKKRHANSDSKSWRQQVELFFPLEIFKLPNCVPLLIAMFFCYMHFILDLTLFLQYFLVIEYNSPVLAAVKILPFTAGLITSSFIFSPKYVSLVTSKGALIISGIMMVGSSIWLSRFDYTLQHEYWRIFFVPLFILGLGVNSFYMLYMYIIMANTPDHLQGLVTGVFQTSGQMGLSICNAVLSTILGNVAPAKGDEAKRHAMFLKFRNVGYFFIAVSSVCLICMLVTKAPKPESKDLLEGESEKVTVDSEK